jgi:hypothetical protein
MRKKAHRAQPGLSIRKQCHHGIVTVTGIDQPMIGNGLKKMLAKVVNGWRIRIDLGIGKGLLQLIRRTQLDPGNHLCRHSLLSMADRFLLICTGRHECHLAHVVCQ